MSAAHPRNPDRASAVRPATANITISSEPCNGKLDEFVKIRKVLVRLKSKYALFVEISRFDLAYFDIFCSFAEKYCEYGIYPLA